MEVFMQNLPFDLTDRGLKQHLSPLIKDLRIEDWDCQKARRKKFGKVTFLRPEDGVRFLSRHGQQVIPSTARYWPRLTILENNVYCKLSNHVPDPFFLKSMLKSAEDRREAAKLPPSPEDPKIIFTTQSISCGIYDYADNELVYSPEVEWTYAPGTAKFAKRALIIDFNNGPSLNRIEIPYRIVETIIMSAPPTALTLTLWETPRFFRVPDLGLLAAMASLSLSPKASPAKNRLTGLPNPVSSHQKVIGQALVYRIGVSPVDFYGLSELLIRREVLSVIRHKLPALPSHARRCMRAGTDELNKTIHNISGQSKKAVPFTIMFQLQALAKNGYLPPWTVQSLLLRIKKQREDLESFGPKVSNTGPIISAEAVRKLLSQIPFPGIDVSPSVFDVDEIWRYLENNEREIQQGLYQQLISEKGQANLTMVHKANVTPTGITLHGPDPEAKNRILRRYPEHTEYFLRVQFCEEDGTDLRFNSRVSNDDIYERFKHVMKSGIAVCGRVYGFLGFSHSSLRSHSAWFMAPFVADGRLESYLTVIRHLGRFNNIFSPARCAARIGQAFSETPFAIPLSENRILYGKLPDVTSRDGHVFSDGVGTISRYVVEAIREAIPRQKGAATCFQIRWGGAKGMLALDDRLEGSTMYVRDSMVKFESDAIDNLEICDTANKPIQMVLNRQMIKILEDMGVPESWFLQQQNAAMQKLQLVTAHISNTAGFLKKQNIADRVGFPQLIRQLESIGVDYKRDRFMRSVVETAVLRELRLLKHKARIPIEHGVTLFGIMDETGYLEDGEIFVTFDEASFIGCTSMDLDNLQMLVTRSPALHPGDIQLARNIIPPDHHPLRRLRNCIVFSQKGSRDLPSCLSGGDLDGDTYNIIWDSVAVSGCQCVFAPAEYPRVPPLNIGRTVEKEDMIEFFVKFMATDQLGLIANRHMILADQRESGTNDEDCKTLAELHSTGVDYSKTGIPVDMGTFKDIKMSRYRPHFLAPSEPTFIRNRNEVDFDAGLQPLRDEEDEDDNAGPQYSYYRSEKVNGVLFDAVDERAIWYRDVKGLGHTDGRVWSDLLRHIKQECNTKLGGIRWERMSKEAFDIRYAYEDAIYNATVDYSTHPTQRLTELEVFTGSILNSSGVQTRRQRDRSLQLKDEFDRIARWAENLIRKRTAVYGDKDEEESKAPDVPNEALMLSIACLDVSLWADGRGRVGRSVEEFESFKILSACCAVRELNAAINRASYVE